MARSLLGVSSSAQREPEESSNPGGTGGGAFSWRRGPLRAAALAAGFLLLLSAVQNGALLLGARAFAGRNGNDFKHIWLGAKLLDDGASPYGRELLTEAARLTGFRSINPYVYLPFTGLAMAPLGRLPPAEAEQAWFFLNHAFLWIGFFLLATSGPPGRREPSFFMLGLGAWLFFSSFSVYRTLTAGQLNAALFMLWALVWRLLSRNREEAAGAVAAFAALFKIAPGFIVFYFLLARRPRALRGMVFGGLAMALWGVARTGPGIWLEFLPLARDMGFGRSTWGDAFAFYKSPSNQSINSFLHHVLADDGITSPWLFLGAGWANRLTLAAALSILGACLWTGWKAGRRRVMETPEPGGGAPPLNDLRERAAFSAFLMGSLLIPSLCWDHYATIAMAGLLLVLWAPETRERPGLVAFLALVGWLWATPWPFEAPRYALGDLPGLWWFSRGPAPSELGAFQVDARSGVGLAFQSLKLWPSLAFFGACLWLARAPWKKKAAR